MIRRLLLMSVVVSIVAAFAAAGNVLAQGAPVRGVVKLKKADGTETPMADATIDVYRTGAGSKGGLPGTKTNKKGEFAFVSIPLGETFAIVASGPGAHAGIEPNVRAGRENIVIILDEGDGSTPTEAVVREALANTGKPSSGGDLTAEQKKAQAEYAAKVAEVEAKNKKIEEANATIARSLQEGNAAYNSKNWDLAITKYNEGVEASPDFAGSAPVLLTNKGLALQKRAVDRYNQTTKLTDASAKVEGYKSVKADLGEALYGFNRAAELLKNAQPGDIKDPKIKESQTASALSGAVETLRLMSRTEQVDDTKLEMAKALLPEYLAVETDAAKKESAKLVLGDVYRVAGDADNAIAEYRKVLESSPDNLDAMAGLGLSLVNAGYLNNNKEQLQEGANVLQKYASAAPDNHKYKADALGLIESLKTEQKITPQKGAAGGGKRKTN